MCQPGRPAPNGVFQRASFWSKSQGAFQSAKSRASCLSGLASAGSTGLYLSALLDLSSLLLPSELPF